MFTDYGDRNIYISVLSIVCNIRLCFRRKVILCSYYIYIYIILLYPFMLSQKNRLCSSFTVGGNTFFYLIRE